MMHACMHDTFRFCQGACRQTELYHLIIVYDIRVSKVIGGAR